ncbi:MAG TPA: hypothetical protein VJ862_11745 [Rhodanobacteraceae bacterium]|nr:hypothetical protein [Rhodanobacteraceae bacterium]
MNTSAPLEELDGVPSSAVVAKAFTGAKLVKGFNHLVATVLEQNPAVHGGRRVVFLASDDGGAAAEIGALAENPGFAPVKLGGFRKVDCLCTRAERAGVTSDRMRFCSQAVFMHRRTFPRSP